MPSGNASMPKKNNSPSVTTIVVAFFAVNRTFVLLHTGIVGTRKVFGHHGRQHSVSSSASMSKCFEASHSLALPGLELHVYHSDVIICAWNLLELISANVVFPRLFSCQTVLLPLAAKNDIEEILRARQLLFPHCRFCLGWARHSDDNADSGNLYQRAVIEMIRRASFVPHIHLLYFGRCLKRKGSVLALIRSYTFTHERFLTTDVLRTAVSACTTDHRHHFTV